MRRILTFLFLLSLIILALVAKPAAALSASSTLNEISPTPTPNPGSPSLAEATPQQPGFSYVEAAFHPQPAGYVPTEQNYDTPHMTPGATPGSSATPSSGSNSGTTSTSIVNYNLALPFKSLSDTIGRLITEMITGQYEAVNTLIGPPLNLIYEMAVAKPTVIDGGSLNGKFSILGDFKELPDNCGSVQTEIGTRNILECYMVRGWLASRNISLFLLPLTLMMTAGAALRNCSTSVTGYADAREALINWFLSIGEMLISLWAIGLVLGLVFSISEAFVGFFPELQGHTFGDVMAQVWILFLRAVMDNASTVASSQEASFVVIMAHIFATIMVLVSGISVIFSILAQNILLTLLVILCPLIFCLCTMGPLKWFQGLWWKAIAFCIILTPINRILMSGSMIILLNTIAQPSTLTIATYLVSLLVTIGFLSIMITLNITVVKLIFGSAIEVGGKFASTVMGMLDLVASVAGLAIGGPAGAAVGGSLGGAASKAVSNATPSGGGGDIPGGEMSASERGARNRQAGSDRVAAAGSVLARSRIPGLSGFGTGLSAGASAEGRSASMDESYFRSLRMKDSGSPAPHAMEDAPKGSLDDSFSKSRESYDSFLSKSPSYIQNVNPGSSSSFDPGIARNATFDRYKSAEPATKGLLENVRRIDPGYSQLAGSYGAGALNLNFSEYMPRLNATVANLTDASYGLTPRYSNSNAQSWFNPTITHEDRVCAAQVIASKAEFFGGQDGKSFDMASPELNEKIASVVHDIRITNRDMILPEQGSGVRGWDRVFTETTNRSFPELVSLSRK